MERARRRSMRRPDRGWLAGLAAGVFVLVVAAGCGLVGGEDPELAGAAGVVDPSGTADAPTEEATVEPTADRPTATPKPRPTSRKLRPKRAKATPTADPNWHEAPACATFEGPKVARPKVRSALRAAAATTYWPTSAPSLKVPYPLVKAIAWQESGWQSDIVNCDGGRGVMQAMPDMVAHMNQRFGRSYDATKYRENAAVGANYLAWLTKKFGDEYFSGRYSLSSSTCQSHSDTCLLNLVIAGYNAGDGGVAQGKAAGELPNPGYVDSVRSLMRSCYCDRY